MGQAAGVFVNVDMNMYIAEVCYPYMTMCSHVTTLSSLLEDCVYIGGLLRHSVVIHFCLIFFYGRV